MLPLDSAMGNGWGNQRRGWTQYLMRTLLLQTAGHRRTRRTNLGGLRPHVPAATATESLAELPDTRRRDIALGPLCAGSTYERYHLSPSHALGTPTDVKTLRRLNEWKMNE